MICDPCRTQDCETCRAVNCCCGHANSTVRPLTTAERHDYMVGRRTTYLVLREPVQPPGERTPPAQEGP